MSPARRAVLSALSALLIAGCGASSVRETEPRPPVVVDGAPAAAGAPARAAMNLPACIEAALDASRSVRIAERRILVAEDRLQEGWSYQLPRVTAQSRLSARSNEPGATLGGQSFVTGQQRVGVGRVELLVPIYDFGVAGSLRDGARAGIAAAHTEVLRERQELALSVALAYHRVLESRRIRGVVDGSIAVVARQLAVARDFLSQGLVARGDVLSAEVQLAERRGERIRALGNVALAEATLNRLMGRAVERPVDIVDVAETGPWPGSLAAAVALAVERRPDLEVLRRRVDAAKADATKERAAGFAPRIFAFASYDYNSDSFLREDDWFAAGVAVELPIFDGFASLAKISTADKAVEEARDRRDDEIEDAVLDVKRAWLEMRESAERLPIARTGIAQAEESLRAARDRFAEGLLSSADVLLEEDRLARTRVAYYRALHGVHEARARLEREVGGELP